MSDSKQFVTDEIDLLMTQAEYLKRHPMDDDHDAGIYGACLIAVAIIVVASFTVSDLLALIVIWSVFSFGVAAVASVFFVSRLERSVMQAKMRYDGLSKELIYGMKNRTLSVIEREIDKLGPISGNDRMRLDFAFQNMLSAFNKGADTNRR